MAEDTFETFIVRERQRLHKERQELLAKQQELQGKLLAVDRELAAIAAYEQAKAGKTDAPRKPAGAPRSGRRSRIRNDLLALISSRPEGMTRREILEAMQSRGDKRLEQSTSNALSALKKSGQLKQSTDRRYHAAQPVPEGSDVRP